MMRYLHTVSRLIKRLMQRAIFLALFIATGPSLVFAAGQTVSHGVSIFGDLKYGPSFKHFEYVNPKAPKGGNVKLATIGTYDSLNPFILKGIAASGINLLFETLAVSSADETSSAYGLIAESIEIANDKTTIAFNLRPEAIWHDGSPITAHDVVFSFNTITQKGHPYYRSYYKDIAKAEAITDKKVVFTSSNTNNKELPLIISQLPIISKQYYETHPFDKTSLQTPMGSGPYKIKSLEAGRFIAYERVADHWAANLPVNIGRYNFDTIRYDYYRDATVAIEALKAGEYDFRRENISKTWANAYNIEQVNDKRMLKEELTDGTPTGMQCFVFNTRRANFNHPKVREALSYAYDFEWANKQLFFGAYARNTSFFGNSIFASSGLPLANELELLSEFKQNLPPRLFTQSYKPPTTDGSGNNRANLIKAKTLLKEAGWFLRDMRLINPQTDKPVNIEFLLASPSFERVVSPYIRNLKKLGIDATIRTVDSSQYVKRLESFDFDVMVNWFTQGPMPGNEQNDYWHSSRVDLTGSKNYAGVNLPAVDAMVEKIITASDKDQLITATKALDRVLLWNFYVIPQWHSRTHRVIYWNKFGRPAITPPYSLGFLDTWWVDSQKANALIKHTR